MKALLKRYPKPGLWLDEVPIPEYGINDVLVKVHKASICGTDVHIWNWDAWAQKTIPVPMVIGHEFVGTVAAMGSNVHDLEIGDIVVGEGHIVCGRCRNCQHETQMSKWIETCSDCQSGLLEIIAGKELEIIEFEGS